MSILTDPKIFAHIHIQGGTIYIVYVWGYPLGGVTRLAKLLWGAVNRAPLLFTAKGYQLGDQLKP